MKAVLLHREKHVLPDGSIIEMVIWRTPAPIPGSSHPYKCSSHPYKYRLYYGRNGARVVGFDNERGKGDHCHLDGVERPYRFTDVEELMRDFLAAVYERMPT